MDYQKGQAAKTEQLEAALQAELDQKAPQRREYPKEENFSDGLSKRIVGNQSTVTGRMISSEEMARDNNVINDERGKQQASSPSREDGKR